MDQWNDPNEFPDELSPSGNSISVDVLVFNYKTQEHTIGWFDFDTHTWRFLCRETQSKTWKWRHFINSIDKYNYGKKKRNVRLKLKSEDHLADVNRQKLKDCFINLEPIWKKQTVIFINKPSQSLKMKTETFIVFILQTLNF